MAIPVVTAVVTGVLSAPGAVGSTETINGNYAAAGADLRVSNGSGGSINVTFTDPGHTALGNTGTQAAVVVAAGATKYLKLTPGLVDPTANTITVAFSATTSVTAEIIV